MGTGFEHQDPAANFSVVKSAQTPQHGQKPDPQAVKIKEKRSFQPRQAH